MSNAVLTAALPERYPLSLDQDIARWKTRDFPLVLGRNCAANGFYWRAREFMGTENLSCAWYDYPALMHEMMEFFADFIIETSRPVLERVQVDYFVLNEGYVHERRAAARAGPLTGSLYFLISNVWCRFFAGMASNMSRWIPTGTRRF